MSQANWVSSVTHPEGYSDCPALLGTWPQVIEQPIDYVAPGIARQPSSDYVCTRCGCVLVLAWRTAVPAGVDH